VDAIRQLPLSAWLLLVAGGAVGTVFRFLLSTLVGRPSEHSIPRGTLAVNVLGCLAIGLVAGIAERQGALSATLRLALVAGLLGGFTTFSAFGLELFGLMRAGRWEVAGAYLVLSNVAGVAAVWAGFRVAQGVW